MSSKPTQQATSTQVSEPWAGQQPYLKDLFSKAQGAFNTGGPQYFPGAAVAPQSGDTLGGQNMMRSAATGMQPVAQAGLDTSLWNMGAGRDVANNPYLKSAILAAQQPVVEGFYGMGGPMSAIRGHFTGANSGGSGTREGIAAGVAERGLNQQLLNTSAGMTMDAYNTAQQNSMQSLALLPQTMEGAAYPGSLMSGIGGQNDAYAQALINAEMQKWNYGQQLPWMNLQNYQGLVGGSTGGGTSTVTAPAPSVNPWMSTLGGAASGAAITKNPWGALIGAGIGFMGSR